MMVALVSLVDIGKQYNDKFQLVEQLNRERGLSQMRKNARGKPLICSSKLEFAYPIKKSYTI